MRAFLRIQPKSDFQSRDLCSYITIVEHTQQGNEASAKDVSEGDGL
jgi:hypothetical protein